MKLRATMCVVVAFVAALGVVPLLHAQVGSTNEWLEAITGELRDARAAAARGDLSSARGLVLRSYLDRFEVLEAHYGSGPHAELVARVGAGEIAFHRLLQSADAVAFDANARVVETEIARIRAAVRTSGLSDRPVTAGSGAVATRGLVSPAAARTPEIRAILTDLEAADAAYRSGSAARALALVEHAYLEGFEPLESRLPAGLVDGIERRIHLELRPALTRGASAATVTSLAGHLGADLARADDFLADGARPWFAAVNSFVIIVREGLEAVLLVGALLAYLAAIGSGARHRRHIFAGVAAGLLATGATWVLARTLLPISGASRELLEGVTALAAVLVLLYVGHWLFQKTYIHDWKDYLRSHVGEAVTSGSAFALALLAFAAVYREGFETVLFYQALAFDAGVGPILAGFIPGMILILALGVGIIRAGLKLPLKRVFGWTNAILMYLAFVFLGKGIYNLQEAGLFAPHPLALPDHPALRQLLGFYPLAETVAAQAALVTAIVATYVWYRRRASGPAPRTAPLPAPPAAAPPASPDTHHSRPGAPSGGLPRARARSGR